MGYIVVVLITCMAELNDTSFSCQIIMNFHINNLDQTTIQKTKFLNGQVEDTSCFQLSYNRMCALATVA
jgi:hypothetical protein